MQSSVAQFPITDNAVHNFRRWVKKPKDCVINAMELLQCLDSRTADICRIMVGDIGLQTAQIEQIFSLLHPSNYWKFVKFPDLRTLEYITQQELRPGKAMFCGYAGSNTRHVFLIAKSLNGDIMYVDPHVNTLCALHDPRCVQYIEKQRMYYVLQHARIA